MVSSTLESTGGPYIVVLDVTADYVRALLFDNEVRRVEGYSAQLPKRVEASADCLDEMHRLVHADGFKIAAVVGYAAEQVTAEDRAAWPGFEGAAWFGGLPEGAGMVLGCGGAPGTFVLLADAGQMATVTDTPVDGAVRIDEKKWLVTRAGDADVYAALKKDVRGSLEAFLETAPAEDPKVLRLDAAARGFRAMYDALAEAAGSPEAVIAVGKSVLGSTAWTRKIEEALGRPVVLCTEPEPAGHGAALWATEKIGEMAKT